MKKCPLDAFVVADDLVLFAPEELGDMFVLHALDMKQVGVVPSGMRDKRVQKALTYIREHCCEDVSLGDVADLVCMSEEGFRKLLWRFCNKTVLGFLNECRIALAMEKLITTDELIANIAFDCGYNFAKSFSRCFREQTGMLPAEFRRVFDRFNREMQGKVTAVNRTFYLLPAS